MYPVQRDKLIASVRRNSRLACLQAQEKAEAASSSAKAMYEKLTDKVIDAWSESQLKEFCDKNSINGESPLQLRLWWRKRLMSFQSLKVPSSTSFGRWFARTAPRSLEIPWRRRPPRTTALPPRTLPRRPMLRTLQRLLPPRKLLIPPLTPGLRPA